MTIEIREAGPADMELLDAALRALGDDLGDPHRANPELLARVCHGSAAFAAALLAVEEAAPAGAALITPGVSTFLGQTGTQVSDLWVAEAHRGTGLGRRLLAAAARTGARRWGASYMKLSVYDTSPRARAVYRHLGFAFRDAETNALLTGQAYAALAAGAD